MDRYQLTIIGAGPGGYTAALRASALGLKTLLVEREHLGGTCLNYGCIPARTLWYSARLYRDLKKAGGYGFSIGEVLFDYARIQERKNSVVKHLVEGLDSLLRGARVEVCSGVARLTSPGQVEIDLPGGERRVAATDKAILATGSEEMVPPIPGVGLPGVIFSREALALNSVPASMAVIGGGVTGLEMASIFASFGSAVTIVEQGALLHREDREMVRRLAFYLRRQGIRILTEVALQRIEQNGQALSLFYTTPRGEGAVTADTVLVAAGRKAACGGLDLNSLGVKHDASGIFVNRKQETVVPGLYAIGDAASPGYFLAHTASRQGVVAAENAAGGNRVFHGDTIPVSIFTQPELSRVGLTEEQAVQMGYTVKIGKFPFSANGKAFIQGDGEGVVKIVAHGESGTVLGVHILGPHASELIQEGTLAVASGARITDLQELIHPHPTLSETVWEAALAVNSASIHLGSP